jgi:hypothetical protein
MKKRNYKSPTPIWCVTNRTKRIEKNYKGWDYPPKNPIQPKTKKQRWMSRLDNKTEEE